MFIVLNNGATYYETNKPCRKAGATPGDADVLLAIQKSGDGAASSEMMLVQSQTTMMMIFSDLRSDVPAVLNDRG